VPPGDFMLSLERAYNKYGTLARTPESLASQLTRAPKGPRGKRGLGQGGQEWFCLHCVEALCHRMSDPDGRNNQTGYDPRFQALFAMANWILADERYCNDCPGYFRPPTPYQYGLELWKAVKLVDQSRLDGVDFRLHCPKSVQVQPCDLLVGADGESWYLNEEARSISYTFPNGVSIETVMKAADVRGKWLREVLGFVSNLIAHNGTVAPTLVYQNQYHIGGASMSDYTVAELAIWNSPDNELNPRNAKGRRHGVSKVSTSAVNPKSPANIPNSSRTALHRKPNRGPIGRETPKSQLNTSSAAAGTLKETSSKATDGVVSQNTGRRVDAITKAAGSDRFGNSSDATENPPPSSSTVATTPTPPTATLKDMSNDMSDDMPQHISNEPTSSLKTPTLPLMPPQQSRKRALDFTPLSQLMLPELDIYELVAREREVWTCAAEAKEGKRRRRDETRDFS